MDTDANPYLDVPAADTAATAVPTNRLRLTGGAALAKAIHERGGGRGLISICAAGGLGITAIVEK